MASGSDQEYASRFSYLSSAPSLVIPLAFQLIMIGLHWLEHADVLATGSIVLS